MTRFYEAAIWPGNDVERARWAVLGPTGCFTFPKRYGRAAAERLAAQYNATVTCDEIERLTGWGERRL